ncbi:MAG: ATP-dependent helicase, partial [Deltaproteobacteria bacterium]|nr:ATP-dependent helicase [Deltaproteobacteria bacterium]
SLLTLHAAKGLEFAVVFIVGCEDGIVPLRFGGDDGERALAEERRLFYVGLTRARDRLVLSRCLRRRWRGQPRELPITPFALDIEPALLAQRAAAPWRRRRADKQLELL